MEEPKVELLPPAPGGYDEMLLGDGSVRPHYEAYQEWLRQLRDRAFVEIRLDER